MARSGSHNSPIETCREITLDHRMTSFIGFAFFRRCVCLLFLGLGAHPLAQAADRSPQTSEASPRYETRKEHDPNGIGKFYMDREIAIVMGHQAADWLERPSREEEEQSERMVEQLGIQPGTVVADIGSGTGYFSRRLAKLVGPTGKVLAVDIQPEMLDLLTNRMAGMGFTNVVPILGTITDPRLPAKSVDVALMVDVYHEFSFPYEMMTAICLSLKPDGRVIFVEFRKEDPKVPVKLVHKMTEAQVKREMAALPLDWVETIGGLPRQHIIIFKKRAPGVKRDA
jgi:SAM-dependent methyltransferase